MRKAVNWRLYCSYIYKTNLPLNNIGARSRPYWKSAKWRWNDQFHARDSVSTCLHNTPSTDNNAGFTRHGSLKLSIQLVVLPKGWFVSYYCEITLSFLFLLRCAWCVSSAPPPSFFIPLLAGCGSGYTNYPSIQLRNNMAAGILYKYELEGTNDGS